MIQKIGKMVAELIGRDSWIIRHLRPTYESLLDLASGGKGISWQINGAKCRIDPHYRSQLAPHYDEAVAEFVRPQVKVGDICFIVGANVGVYVLQFAHWSAPSGRVVAFEPNPGAYQILQRHIAINNLGDRVTPVPDAVGAVCGTAVLYACDTNGMSRVGSPNPQIAPIAKDIPVRVLSLDHYSLVNKVTPNWLIMDIEGFEIAALCGARRLIEERRGHLHIVLEVHPDAWAPANTSREEAEALLKELKLRPVPLMNQSDPLGEHGTIYLDPYLP